MNRVQLKCDGTRWSTGGEVKEKLANAMRSQYSSHYLGTCCIQHHYRWCAHLGCQYSTELTPHANLNGLVRFDERRNLVSARMPSHFNWPLPGTYRGEKERSVRTADNLTTFIYRLSRNWKLQSPGTLTACPSLYRDTFTFTFTFLLNHVRPSSQYTAA